MSVITDLLLVTGFDESDAIAKVNEWCVPNDERKQEFTRIDREAAGGYKVFTSRVWAMSANHFDWQGLAEALPSFGWRWPTGALLVVHHEHHDEEVIAFRADGARIGRAGVAPLSWAGPR